MSEQWIPENHGLSDPNGWPDPQRPGVPLNPERSGPHSFQGGGIWAGSMWWSAGGGYWIPPGSSATFTPDQIVRSYQGARYLGPCLPPDEKFVTVPKQHPDPFLLMEAINDAFSNGEGYLKERDMNKLWATIIAGATSDD